MNQLNPQTESIINAYHNGYLTEKGAIVETARLLGKLIDAHNTHFDRYHTAPENTPEP